jgi:hypothetical protein
MNNSGLPVVKRNFWTKSYVRSALIAFAVSGTLNQMSADNPEMRDSLIVMGLTDLANIALFVFLGAGIFRFIRSKAKGN